MIINTVPTVKFTEEEKKAFNVVHNMMKDLCKKVTEIRGENYPACDECPWGYFCNANYDGPTVCMIEDFFGVKIIDK